MSGWKAVILLVPFQFMFGLVYAWGAMAVTIRAATGWPVGTLDFIFSLTPLVLLPAVLTSGRLLGRPAGRVFPGRILQWALGCFIAGGALALMGDSPLLFAIGYACIALGLGGGLATPACIEIMHRVAPRAHGRLSGLLLAIYGLSASISAPLFLGFVHYVKWRIALAGVMVIYGVLGMFSLRGLNVLNQDTAMRAAKPDPALPDAIIEITQITQARTPWRPIVSNVILLLASVPLGSAVFAAIGRLAIGHGHTASLGVAGASLMSLANGVGRFAGGVLSGVGSVRATWCILLGLSACGYGASLIDATASASAWFLLFALLTGLAFGGLAGNLPALAAHVSPSSPARVFSFYFAAFALGSFGGPMSSAALGLPMTLTVLGATTFGALAVCMMLVIKPVLSRRCRAKRYPDNDSSKAAHQK